MTNRRIRKGSEKGSVTIEASIALPAFLFMFIIIYSLITVCRAETHIQIAIDATAKELSQYSYLYGLTGLDTAMAKFEKTASGKKAAANNFMGGVVDMLNGVQSLGQDAVPEALSIENIQKSWSASSEDLKGIANDFTSLRTSVENAAKDPQSVVVGLAQILGSEALNYGASKAIAEPISRALVQKHLKRGENDTADAFCRSVGIEKGSYFGKESYFNGLDFSHSTLFPYGTDDIKIIVTYKIRVLPLLPVDYEFQITQTAHTKAWLHGDLSASDSSPSVKRSAMEQSAGSIWNADLQGRIDLIRHQGIDYLKEQGYYGVTGGHASYIHAYDPDTNTFVNIASSNPLYGLRSPDEVDREAIRENLERLAAQMESNTDNIQQIQIKRNGTNGTKTETIDCKGDKHLKVILTIPADEGLDQIYEEIIREMDTSVNFELNQSYGSVFIQKPEADAGEGGEEG